MSQQQTIFCHSCHRQSTENASSWSGRCSHCQSDFVEVVRQSHRSQPQAPRAHPRRGQTEPPLRPRPGGSRRNAVGPSASGRNVTGGALQGTHPVLQLLAEVMGDYIGNSRIMLDMMEGQDEEWLDQIASRLMEEYQPTSTPTAAKIRNALPTYAVRPRSAKGEPGTEDACVCAGEECTVCHDEFTEGLKVAELPCSHCFHADCIAPWLETHNTCPVCRIELPQDPS